MKTKQEKPTASSYRLYKSQRVILRRIAASLSRSRKEKVSESQVVREAIESYARRLA